MSHAGTLPTLTDELTLPCMTAKEYAFWCGSQRHESPCRDCEYEWMEGVCSPRTVRLTLEAKARAMWYRREKEGAA